MSLTYAQRLALKPACCQGTHFNEQCKVHVGCDANCLALLHPGDDVTELSKALDHWQGHGYLSGCAHGE